MHYAKSLAMTAVVAAVVLYVALNTKMGQKAFLPNVGA